jgi:hypothetical protein
MVSASVMATADELVRSAIDVNSATRASLVDVWIGSRVRIRRTSLGMSRQEGIVTSSKKRLSRRLLPTR